MKKDLVQFLLLLLFCFAGAANAVPYAKSPLKVLFVGYDPSKPAPVFERDTEYPGGMTKVSFMADYPVRMRAFKILLNAYFTEVATIDCRDWKPGDSEAYDVTIFDFRPRALEPAREEKLANGKTKYHGARYLPENFSKPVVFIASTASEMGRAIGLKLDWLCLCLNADAHHINTKHPIFKGPLEKVKPTMVLKKTPDGVFNYSTGANLPKQIPMWNVQKTDYWVNGYVRIGLVSRGERFTESPDAEIVSSGVCAKDVGAVALGRHGNFFLWGFGASPSEMTEEAKKVFVNTVAYMKQFENKIPIARKYNERMATTDDVKETIASANKEAYERNVTYLKSLNEESRKYKQRFADKIAAGQKLTPEDSASYNAPSQDIIMPTYENYIKRTMGRYSAKFGTDVSAFQKYMKDNFDYFYCDPDGFFAYEVDEDAKRIGISNHNIRFLQTCIEKLKKNDEPELALKMLKRYTDQNFDTAEDWDNWFKKHKNKLFFSETGGYKFLVNTFS